MGSSRRALALAAVVTLGSAAALVAGASPAHAYPSGAALQAGAVSFNFADPLVATMTQNSPGAVVLFSADDSLDLAATETLNIVQTDPSMVLQIRYTGESPLEWDGTVTASANLVVTSPAGFVIDGSVFAGGDLMISTGEAPFDPDGPANELVFSPLVGDGPLTIASDADVSAGDQLGIFGHVVTLAGSASAQSSATVASTAQATWSRLFENDNLAIVGGLEGGSATVDGILTAPSAKVLTPNPSTQAIDGTVRGTRAGEPGSASVAMSVNGTATEFGAEAVTGGAGLFAGLGAHAAMGDPVPATFTSVTLGTVGTGAVPDDSAAVLSGLVVDEDLSIDIIQARCLIDGGFDIHVAIGGAEFDGTPILPDGYDLTTPNQPAFDLGDGISIAFNVQERAVVGGFELLAMSAVLVTTPEASVAFGVVECGLPAQPEEPGLAATGVAQSSLAPALAGVAMLVGIVLVVSRRRRVLP
jgi:LPXTG-motif cell wall-anchored protein